MKKIYFNQIERQIIKENKTLSASKMILHIAIKKFEREVMKTFFGTLIKKTNKLLLRILLISK